MSYDPEIPLIRMYPKEAHAYVHQETRTRIAIAGLIEIAPN